MSVQKERIMKLIIVTLLVFVAFLSYAECRQRRAHAGSCTSCILNSDCNRVGINEICLDNCCTAWTRRNNIDRKLTHRNDCKTCVDDMNCPETMVCIETCCIPW